MVQPTVTDSHSWCTNSQRPNVELASRPVAEFGGLADKLIECGEDIVGELDLSYCRLTHRCKPNTKAYYALSEEGEVG